MKKKKQKSQSKALQFLEQLKLPLFLLSIILLVLLFGAYLPVEAKQFMYAISLSIKTILLTILPFLIIIFISSSLILLEGRVVSFIITMIFVIFASNYIAVVFSYCFAQLSFGLFLDKSAAIVDISTSTLEPLWNLPRVQILKNEYGILIGLFLGLFFSVYRNKKAHDLFESLQKIANAFLKKCFIPVLPFFVSGFLLKLEHDAVLNKVIVAYAPIFLMFVLSQAVYVVVLLLVISGLSFKTIAQYVKNTLPATITGFSTLSSAATMPVTIEAAEKNSGMHNLSKIVIPATVNIHLVGTSIGMNILILGTMLTFTSALPSFFEYLHFGLYFAITQFATVGVPGGVIFSVIPLLEGHLGFSPEMIGVVSTLVMLFDPVDTAFNVTINALFIVVFARVYRKLKSGRADEVTVS